MTAPRAQGHGRIVDSAEASELAAHLLGGKATNLAALSRAKLPVPPWICLTARVFAPATEGVSELISAVESADPADGAAERAAAHKLGEALRATPLPAEDAAELLRRFDETFSRDALVAVRSSAVGEDSAKDSFAGQMDTYLFVTRETLSDRVMACFASAFSERALVYRRLRGGDLRAVRAAVIVQLMVRPRASGVMFTANPSTASREEIVVAAGYGLGEGIVGSLVETDTYFLDRASGALRECAVLEKRSRIVFDQEAGSGTRADPVPPELVRARVLEDGELAMLAALGRELETLYGTPQDIEWSMDEAGHIHLLQARPITTLVQGRETIFDNSNVVESYPGLSTPLTFSYARAGYFETFHEALRRLGVGEDALARAAPRHQNLVALVNGRIYYNLLNWYGMFETGGFEWMLPAWERALGLPRRYRHAAPRTTRRRLAGLRVKLQLVRYFFGIQRYVDRFTERFRRVEAYYRSHDLSTMEPHSLLDLHDHLALEIRGPYSVSVLNDAFVQQLFGLLGKLIARFELGDPTALSNELLRGESGMQSVEPVRSGLQLAEAVRQDPRLFALFESGAPADEVWQAIHSEAFAGFREALAMHLNLYGDRTLHELKLETPPAEDNPEFVVSILRNYLRGGQSLADLERDEQRVDGRAERSVTDKLSGHPLRRWVFGAVLRRVRQGTRNRENLRLARSRAFGWSKRIYRALAARFVEARLIDATADIFYLTEEEIAGAVRGHAVTQDLRSLVAIRSREYARFRELAPPGRVTIYGMSAGQAPARAEPPPLTGNEAVLRGQGCGPGRVAARAKVVLDPTADLDVDGEILVAPMTDPGWVFLMIASKGLVSEKGSLLSHTAIIGRELGIPTVVGVKNATALIQTGRMIEMDGQAGTVRLLPDQGNDRQ
jgi:pyruvate,water dikinase